MAFVSLLAGASILYAQAGPTASRLADAQVGIGYTHVTQGYVPGVAFQGFAVYGDFDFRPHFGVEAEFHNVNTSAGDQQYEGTYEIGGRYFRTYGRIVPYVKAMIGRGVYNFPNTVANIAYNIYAGSAGADFNVGPHIRVRGEYEYQKWSGFPNGGLSPQLVTAGVAYHFAGKPRYR